ncbi:MAG: DUF2769 domain-containing protein [Methanobacterium formicicum]
MGGGGDQITHTKVPDTEQNALNCLCPVCPVYNECLKTKEELLFCSRGSTKCEFEKWGCKCVRCPVALEYNLVGLFYCEKGAETK